MNKIIVCKSKDCITITENGKQMIIADKSLLDKDKEYITNWYIKLTREEG